MNTVTPQVTAGVRVERIEDVAGAVARPVVMRGNHRACGACGQPVPIRWRNDLGAPLHVVWHTAGPVVESVVIRPNRARYVVDRAQACTDCGRLLRHHPRALWFTPGKSVFEIRVGRAPLLVAERPAGPTHVVECQAS